jgi:hypothetical protein
MKSSQLIKEGRLEEAMQEVNTMLIVNARDDISQETRPATPTAQSEAFYLRG